jgi:hypothetical protein
MSRIVLNAECSTGAVFQDYLKSTTKSLALNNGDTLAVFVGDKDVNNIELSVMPCSGGLYARQHFKWTNLDKIRGMNPASLFLDSSNISVTLSVDLEAVQNSVTRYESDTPEIPVGALAVNLGSRGFQFNTSNMINEDEWGKLVYYEQGGLGLGWSFSANSYIPTVGQARYNGLTMYLFGGMLPDVSFGTISAAVPGSQANITSPFNLQMGRDQALLTQMVTTSQINGPQGYWSVQPTNFPRSLATGGRFGGSLVMPSSNPSTPPFSVTNPFGSLFLSYPTAVQNSTQTPDQSQLGWNLLFPSYGPSTQDGYIMSGNALSIPPGAFFTREGLELLKSSTSNPSDKDMVPWTEYWSGATHVVHLEETKPLYIECPMFNLPIAMEKIPDFDNGLHMLVPITRIANGVYVYQPVADSSLNNSCGCVRMYQYNNLTDPNYFVNALGTLQKWFAPKKVTLRINMPFVRLDTPLQASNFFNVPYIGPSLTERTNVWLKFPFLPQSNPNGLRISPGSIYTTMSFRELRTQTNGGPLEKVLSARTILEKFVTVMNMHGIQPSVRWGLEQLIIRGVCVSVTTYPDLERLYGVLFNRPPFQQSAQGAILLNGGMKMFSRCGPFLSEGSPSKMHLELYDIIPPGEYNDGSDPERKLSCDVNDYIHTGRGGSNNDYFNVITSFMFSADVQLRMPSGEAGDQGGQLTVSFQPRPVLNIPFSGELRGNVMTGGAAFKNTSIIDGTITSTNLASWSFGWFNNLNPFSPDYKKALDTAETVGTSDPYPYLDYKMVDLNHRKIEVWVAVSVPLAIFTTSPFSK